MNKVSRSNTHIKWEVNSSCFVLNKWIYSGMEEDGSILIRLNSSYFLLPSLIQALWSLKVFRINLGTTFLIISESTSNSSLVIVLRRWSLLHCLLAWLLVPFTIVLLRFRLFPLPTILKGDEVNNYNIYLLPYRC